MTDMRDEAGLGESYDPVPEPGQPMAAVYDEVEQDPTPETVDVSPELDPEDFDMDAFLEGVRPFRRAVRLFMRADLVAEMDELGGQINNAPAGTDTSTLVEQFYAKKAAFYDSGRWFVLEARSPEWVEVQRKEMAKEYGLSIKKTGELGDGPRREEALEGMTHELLRRQIVTPTKVSRENLAKLAARSPGEYRKLLVTQGFVNSNLAERSGVLTVDFSRGPSSAAEAS